MTDIARHDQEADFSLWATQGGGYARKTADGDFVWYEIPEWMSSLPDGDSARGEAFGFDDLSLLD